MFSTTFEMLNQSFFRNRGSTMCEEGMDSPHLRKANSTDDRFIPSIVQKGMFDLYQKENLGISNVNKMDEETVQFDSVLKRSILKENGGVSHQAKACSKNGKNRKLLCYNNSSQIKEKDELMINTDRHSEKKTSHATRKIKDAPYKILDAPSLHDDFYFDILDWSANNNITIGLVSHVYCLNSTTGKSFKLTSYYGDNLVSALKSNENGSLMAVGTSTGKLEIYDFEKFACIKNITGHSSRVGAVAWKENIIASGSRDSHIMITDIRSRKSFERKLDGHKQEICGLAFNSFDWNLASGGNDNRALVWDIGKSDEIARVYEHSAAVKALAWSTHQNGILATGGGSTDKKIKIWNVKTGAMLKSVNTGSQVCALRFSKSVNELISTHGFSQNQIEVWSVPEMEQVATLRGHTERVLYLGMSPSGEDIVTASADETLRFWKVFPSVRNSPNIIDSKLGAMSCFMELR